jgi:hypothetical protein
VEELAAYLGDLYNTCLRDRCSHGLEIAACRRPGGAAVGRGEGSK